MSAVAEAPPQTAEPAKADRPTADRFMRSLLRIDTAGREARHRATSALDAQKAMSKSIAISAIRCIITYLIVPVSGPTLRIVGSADRPISIALSLLAGFFSIRSMRKFWAANHPKRWAYTAFAAVVISYVTYGLVVDLTTLA